MILFLRPGLSCYTSDNDTVVVGKIQFGRQGSKTRDLGPRARLGEEHGRR